MTVGYCAALELTTWLTLGTRLLYVGVCEFVKKTTSASATYTSASGLLL